MIIPSEDRSVSEAVRVRRSGHVSGAGYCACSDARPVSHSQVRPVQGRRVTGAVSRQRAGTAFCEVERVTVAVNKVTRPVKVI